MPGPTALLRLFCLGLLTALLGVPTGAAETPAIDIEIDRVSFSQRADGNGFVVRMHADQPVPDFEVTQQGRSLDLVLNGARLSSSFRRDEPRFPVRTYLVSPQRGRVVLHLSLADPMDVQVYRDGGSEDLLLALTPFLRQAATGWGGGRQIRPSTSAASAPPVIPAQRAVIPAPLPRALPVPTAQAPITYRPAPAEAIEATHAEPEVVVRRGPWPTRRSATRTLPTPVPTPRVVIPAPQPAPVSPVSRTVAAPNASNWQLDTIILDAGHGGHDIGATYHGVREKDITLGITRRLGRMIERELGVNVIYTRDDDRFIELRERGRIANRASGKLFISIHANAAAAGSASGTETYFLAPHRSTSARDVMERENSVIELESAPELYAEYSDEGGDILRAMAMSAFQEESQELARLIESQFSGASRRSRGVKQAGFLVLWAASMPAVLVETGFVSNSDEARFLISEDGQEATARNIFRAVAAYKERYERGLRVASASNE